MEWLLLGISSPVFSGNNTCKSYFFESQFTAPIIISLEIMTRDLKIYRETKTLKS